MEQYFLPQDLHSLVPPKDSYLCALLTTTVPHARDAAGRIFIDRDGKHFRHILNYLREGGKWSVTSTNLTEGEVLELATEANYYLLTELYSSLQSLVGESRQIICSTPARCLEITHVLIAKGWKYESTYRSGDDYYSIYVGKNWDLDLHLEACKVADKYYQGHTSLYPPSVVPKFPIPSTFSKVVYVDGTYKENVVRGW